MKLDELTEALEQRGFEKRETSMIVMNDISRDQSNRWHRYDLTEGDIQRTTVSAVATSSGSVNTVIIALPDIVQDMYFNALKQLEEASGIPYDTTGQIKTDYTMACKRLQKELYLGFINLLDRVGIIPTREIPGFTPIRQLEPRLVMLTHPSDEKEFGQNYKVTLVQNNAGPQKVSFYSGLIDQLPSKLEALESEGNRWDALVNNTLEYARATKAFYQAD